MRFLVLVALSVSALPAQRTFVVDAANGAGTHFTDLPPALAQAQHRDVFVVRPGTYSPVSTDKGVTLLGTTGVRIDAGSGPGPALAIVGLPAGETFAARAIEVMAQSVTACHAQACDGRLHFVGLRHQTLRAPQAMTVQACRSVTLADATLISALSVVDSVVVLTGSTLIGHAGGFGLDMSSPALVLERSRALVADCTLRGGSGTIGMGSGRPPSPAISAAQSEVSLAATAAGATQVIAGVCTGGFCSSFTVPAACALTDGIARFSQQVTFTTQFGRPSFLLSGSSQAVSAPLPALVASAGPLGGVLTTSLASGPGDPFLLALALPADPVPHPAGVLFVDFQAWAVVARGQQGAAGRTTFTFPIPVQPSLRAASFVVQAASLAAATQTLWFTNPAVVVLD